MHSLRGRPRVNRSRPDQGRTLTPVHSDQTGIGRLVAKSTGLCVLVALPALFARPWADERIYLYWPEQIAGRNPFLLVERVFYEIPGYLELGVFRWLSRLLTFGENWFLLRTSLTVGIPVNVLRAVPKVAMIALLAAVAYWTIRQYQAATPSPIRVTPLATTLPLAMAASLTLFTPSTHPLTLFPTLYLGTAGLALAIPLWLGRYHQNGGRLHPSEGRLHPRRWVGFALVGAGLASMIELAYLALPLSLLHLLLLGMAGELSWSQLRSSPALKAWLAMVGGFVAVFVPVRILISRACADGACYDAAQPVFGAGLSDAWPQRLLAGAFPLLQAQQWEQTRLALTRDRSAILLGMVAALAAFLILRRAWREPPEGESLRRAWQAGLVYSVAIIILAALLSSLSLAVQQGDLGLRPWRETGFSWVGWSMLLALVSAGWLTRPERPLRLLTGGVLIVGVFLAAVQNQTDLARERSDPEARLHNQVATLLVDFDPTESGNAQRCQVTGQLLALPDADSNRMPFLVGLLDAVATNHYRTSFCSS